MSFLAYVKLYIVTVPIFLIIDLLWLGIIARGFYRSKLDFILSEQVNWMAAVFFYLIYIIGILFFAIRPAISNHSWIQALVLGALFGFFTYATYDLTNFATIKEWPLGVVIVDVIWGAFLCAFVSLSSYTFSKRII